MTARQRILLVDDEPDLLEPTTYVLRQHGFDVDCVETGEDALDRIGTDAYDVMICDVMLPGILGTDVCKAVRAQSALPIILLTAKDAEVDRVLGLEMGADDYVTKPFSSAELVSRVRALLRRRELDREETKGSANITVGGLAIDVARHVVDVDGQPTTLTPSEFRILNLLASEPERVFTRAQIMEVLWDVPFPGDTRACDFHISNLRRKIEREPAKPQRVVTVREMGYTLVPA
jgi:two-component system response regulator RegX3